jgi:hypothetical protein
MGEAEPAFPMALTMEINHVRELLGFAIWMRM